jgi:hypothetical protein
MPPTAPGEEFDAVFFPVGTPEWMAIYLEELFNTCKRARAAQAAGKSLPEIVRIRHADQEFAEREVAILMEAMGDALESEVVERVIPERDGNGWPIPRKRYCSEALLIRLLDIFHPHGGPKRMIMNPGSRGRRLLAPCSREESFKSRKERIAYQTWEREQALALALNLLFNPPPQSQPPTNPPRTDVRPTTDPFAKRPQARSENVAAARKLRADQPAPEPASPISNTPAPANNPATPKKPNAIKARLFEIANRSKRPAPPVHQLHYSKTHTPAITSNPTAKCTIPSVSQTTPTPTALSVSSASSVSSAVTPPTKSESTPTPSAPAAKDTSVPTPNPEIRTPSSPPKVPAPSVLRSSKSTPRPLDSQIRPPELNLDPPSDFQPVYVGYNSFNLDDLPKLIAAKLRAGKSKPIDPDADLPSLQKALDSLARDPDSRFPFDPPASHFSPLTSHDPSPPRASPDTS